MFKHSLPEPVKIAILHDGFSDASYSGMDADIQDTLDTVESIKQALSKRGHQVETREVTKKNVRSAVNVDCDICFNLVEDHGWTLAKKSIKLLMENDIPVVGYDSEDFSMGNNKAKIKKALVGFGLPTANFQIFTKNTQSSVLKLKFPVIVKPSREHAGIGISQASVVETPEALYERVNYILSNFSGEALVEEYIDGKEIHATVLGNGEVHVLPLTEIKYVGEFQKAWKIYSYEAKWDQNSWEYWNAPIESPANLTAEETEKINYYAKKAFVDFHAKDFIRLDFRVDRNGNPYILDVNINPSLKLDPLDATWASAQAMGWSYEDLIETIAGLAYRRAMIKKSESKEVSKS
jgi:D-alanine-D-alanine ligase